MKTIAQAFVELAGYLEHAKFDDPDEAQGAEELVSWCLAECSSEERDLLCDVATTRVSELRAKAAPQAIINFYESFVARVTNVA